MKSKKIILVLGVMAAMSCTTDDSGSVLPINLPDDLPNVQQAVFSNSINISNQYYGLPEGKTYVYKGGEVNMEPEEEIRIERRLTTKVVMGVECIIHHDVVFKDGILIEDTDDWLAQDDDGNLWYFGEFVKNYDDDGNFLDNDGSWEAGVDEALPGYWLPINPFVGQKYYQEYYEDEAEDHAEVLMIAATVTIGLGVYENCLVTKDINPFETGVYEKKYYAPGIGFILEEKFEDNVLVETVELIEIIN